jgi:formylmethanofuran dehydrogenase subunit E
LLFHDYGKQVYTLYSRSTRKGVRVVFHGNGIPAGARDDREAFARWILSAPQKSILSVNPVSIPEPEPARIRESAPCTVCGETVMESRVRDLDGKAVCIPCFARHQPTEQAIGGGA